MLFLTLTGKEQALIKQIDESTMIETIYLDPIPQTRIVVLDVILKKGKTFDEINNKLKEKGFSFEEESSLLQNYGQEALAQIIGVQKYRIMTSDPKSWDYFDKKFIEFNNNVKANLLTSSQCEAYKIKFFNELAVMKQQQHQQRIDKAKADEFRAWYVGQMMSQDLKSRGNQHRVTVEYK